MITVDRLAISDVVELVNEYADPTRRAAGETGAPYPTLEPLAPFDAGPSTLVALANDLHPVFGDPAHAPELLNALVDRLRLRHRLTGRGEIVWMRPEEIDAVAAAAIAALVDLVVTAGADRLGMCEARSCVDVYVDASHARTRSYCSPQCRTRDRVARWRAARR